MNRLVIDTDPGVDDAHAIMMALAHPNTQVEAITTVAGNVGLSRTTANACTILEALDRDIPVYPGCDRPLVGPTYDAVAVHGADGLGESGFAPPVRQPAAEHAVHALIRLANEAPGVLTLVAIAPLTNIALATRLDPGLPHKYRQLIVMGGAIRAMGNTANPAAEFNIYCDPEAAAIVFGSWPRLTLVSWETTMAHSLGREQVRHLLAAPTPRGEFFRRITRYTLAFHESVLGEPTLFAPDALAMAVAMEPQIVRQAEMRYVGVELAGPYSRGQTVVDWFNVTRHVPNANVVLEADRARFWELMQSIVY